MRFSGTDRDDDDPWFHLGTLAVTTTVLVLLVWVVTLLIWTVEGVAGPVNTALVLFPDDVLSGEVWRVVTWPWSHGDFTLWAIIDAALFWVFGTSIEQQIKRRAYTALIAWSIVIISLAAVAWSAVIPGATVIFDLRLLELTVLLLFCAERPTQPFFFNIPAWAIAAIIVALEVINDVANRDWIRLLTMIVAAFFIAIVARKLGLLSQYDRIPSLSLPTPRRAGRAKERGQRGGGSSAAGGPTPGRGGRPGAQSGPTPDAKKRSGPLWGRGRSEPAEIVEMPQGPAPRRAASPQPDLGAVSADDLALDALLDKIAEGGLAALTPAERQELDDLRARRRGSKG